MNPRPMIPGPITRGLRAGALYFLAMFAVGFALGPVRVFLLEPRLGELGAVLCEAPALLAASWIMAGQIARRLRLPGTCRARATMGLSALLLLQAAELLFAYLLRGASAGTTLDRYTTPAGWVGGALALAFAAAPLAVKPRTASERK
ncbi:MAG: hypothetical protein AB7G15_14965 [Alphaproteobacteria bacterium]